MSFVRCAVVALAINLGPALVLAAGKNPPVTVEIRDVRLNSEFRKLKVFFDVTANQAIKEGAIILKARCSFDGTTKTGEGSSGLENMEKGDKEQKNSFLINIDTDALPSWCQFAINFAPNQINDGKEIATVCLRDGRVTDGKCAR